MGQFRANCHPSVLSGPARSGDSLVQAPPLPQAVASQVGRLAADRLFLHTYAGPGSDPDIALQREVRCPVGCTSRHRSAGRPA